MKTFFQLTKEEYEKILMSKNLTSNWGGTRKLPFAKLVVFFMIDILFLIIMIKMNKYTIAVLLQKMLAIKL